MSRPPTQRGCSSATAAPPSRSRRGAKGFYWPPVPPPPPARRRSRAPCSSSRPPVRTSSTASWRSSGRPHAARAGLDAPVSAAERWLSPPGRWLCGAPSRHDRQPRRPDPFVRAIAEQLENDRERAVAADFGRLIGRLDMGVWAAREARTKGANFYSRAAFPSVQIPAGLWPPLALAHGIMRQESSFERSAVSSAGARGMMQLMPGTAAEAASRLGVSYGLSRLTATRLQRPARQLSPLPADGRMGRNAVRSPRPTMPAAAMSVAGCASSAIRGCPAPTSSVGSSRSPSRRPAIMCSGWSELPWSTTHRPNRPRPGAQPHLLLSRPAPVRLRILLAGAS